MSMESKFPNFFIIGAAKSGTTGLFDVLQQHPQIFVPYLKEPRFFSDDEKYQLGQDWYSETYFNHSEGFKARGEATPHYLYWGDKTSSRILKLPDAKKIKIIAIFRDPVKRAYSQYWMQVHRGVEPNSFEEALQKEDQYLEVHHDSLERSGSLQYAYFHGGCYASLLKPYLERFSGDNIGIFLLEDLKNDFSNTMLKVCHLLEIDDQFEFQPKASNQAFKPRSMRIQYYLHNPSGDIYQAARSLVKKTSPSFQYKLRQKILGLNTRPAQNPPMLPETEANLRLRFRPEVEKLEAILNRSLDHWKVK